MSAIMKIKYSLFFCLCLNFSFINAQTDKPRPKESDILLEQLFIDANREKILGNIDEAIKLYLEVIQKDDKNAAANFEVARLYKRQDDYAKANEYAAKAVEIEPYNLLYNELYATLLEKESNYKRAVEIYTLLNNHYPDNEQLYYDLAYFLTKYDKADQAIKVYNALEKRIGIKETISMRKYKLYMATAKDKKAIQELERLSEAFPQEAEYIIRIANFYTSTQQLEEAKKYYQKALDLDPSNPTANIAMIEFFLQSGDTTRYLNALLTTFGDNNQDVETKIKVLHPLVNAVLQNKMQAHEKAILDLSQKLTQNYPQNPTAQFLQGELFFHRKDYAQAAKSYSVSLLSFKNNLQLWQHLLESLLQSNNQPEFQQKSSEMMDLYPNQISSFHYYGIALFQQQKYTQAEKELRQAIELGGEENPQTLERYGDVLFKLAKEKDAVAYWQKALDKTTDKSANTDLLRKKISNKQLYE